MNYEICGTDQLKLDLEPAASQHLAATQNFPAVVLEPIPTKPVAEAADTAVDVSAETATEQVHDVAATATAAQVGKPGVAALLANISYVRGRVSVIGDQAVVEADCLPVLDQLPDASVDILIAGPTCKGACHTTGPMKGQLRIEAAGFFICLFREAARILKPETGSLFLSLKAGSSERLLYALLTLMAERHGLKLQNEITVVSSIAIDGLTRGQYTPLPGEAYLNNTSERVLHLTPTGRTPLHRALPGVGVPYADKANLARFGHSEDLHCAGNTLFMPPKTIAGPKAPRGPAPFSAALVRHLLLLGGAGPDSIVIDPVVGGGTTLEVARELGVPAIGIEVDPAVAAMARTRLAAVK